MDDNVLYVKNEKMSASDVGEQESIWDDTLLIKAYEKAVNSAKEKVTEKINQVAEKINIENGDETIGEDEHLHLSIGQSTNNGKGKKHRKPSASETKGVWTVGTYCRATYSEDGIEYEAVITNVNASKGTCRVKYIGYNNEEMVFLGSLKPSQGSEARKLQVQQCEINKEITTFENCNNNNNNVNFDSWQYKEQQGMIPPPPPPHVMAHFPKDESDALSAMLMAWYMSGYHTGYYQGLTKGRNKFAN